MLVTTLVHFSHSNFLFANDNSGRAKMKMDELERLLEVAKRNFVQLGGSLEEDRRRLREMRDKDQ